MLELCAACLKPSQWGYVWSPSLGWKLMPPSLFFLAKIISTFKSDTSGQVLFRKQNKFQELKTISKN